MQVDARGLPAQVGRSLSRGFPLGLAQQRHPSKNSRSDYLIISPRVNKILDFRVTHFLPHANGRAYRRAPEKGRLRSP